MIFSTDSMSYSISTEVNDDRSKVYIDNKVVAWNTETERNYLILDHEPSGEIISLAIIKDGETLVVDGKPNTSGKTIEFLYGDNLAGSHAEIKYLIF